MNWTATDFTEHPEGGRFREVYRSPIPVHRKGQPDRPACTHIYFHLRSGEVSRFHKVNQEEIWNLYEGSLRLWIYQEETQTLEEHVLSAETTVFCAVIPASSWQAAEPLSPDTLVGCTVAPGFDFADFELITTDSPVAKTLSDRKLGRLL